MWRLLLLTLTTRAAALTASGGDHGNDSAGGGGPTWWSCNATSPGEEGRAREAAAVFSCGGGWCVAERALCNGVPDCPAGEDESVHQCGCLPNEFRCSNSCIDLVRRCDREPNCPDQEDETGCESFVCPVTHFKCANHYCVPEDAVCNFEDDCGDGSDEQNCSHRTCWNSEFRCDNGECIRPGYVCDGVVDCKDASDEAHCTPDFFRICGDGTRVHRFFWCDDWTHCADNHADELNCTACDGADKFRCPNGRCIRRANLCDSYCDCAPTERGQGCADEAGCQHSYLQRHGMSVCTPGKTLLCIPHPGSREDRCIAPEYICDGHNDCHNGNYVSDELGCRAENSVVRFLDVSVPLPTASSSVVLTGQWFTCSEGRMIPQELRCDFKWDCLLGDDEEGCERIPCSKNEFTCSNGQCIPIESQCDLRFDCWDKSDEFNCKEAPCPPGQLKCSGSGQCVPRAWWCDFYLDCPDGSDELSCVGRGRECGRDEFRCLSGQCVPRTDVCFKSGHERSGCADGSHLLHCENVTCPEDTFKCRNGPCLNMSLRCNAFLDCKDTWVDEDGCTFQCSTEPRCVCHDTKINCTSLGLTEFPAVIEFQINRFYMANNLLNETLNEDSFSKLDRLVYLDLRNNSISRLPAMIFRNLWRLHILNLQDNHISVINNGSFFGLPDLRTLHLQGNGIEVLEPMAFYGLSSITTLDLKHQRIRNISRNAFVGLRSLVALDLSFNHIFYLADGALNGMPKLETLDLSNNFIKNVGNNVFRSVTALKTLVTDEFRFCCVARHAARCLPAPDEFSSCEDLMSNLVLRVCVWVLGVVATAGNALVIAWRMRFKHSNQVHSFLITNLAIGDLFMGSYLLIIAAADAHYRGVYSVHDRDWRSSALCSLAGFISTFSSEFSVYTLTVITLDRFLVIIFPFRIRRLEMSKTRMLMAAGWAVAAFLSGLPLFRIDYFRNFYGRSGVCLALHITPDKPSGWEYSVFVFLFLNLASFSVIALGYVWMYAVARTTQRAVQQQHKRPDSATMARRMTLIVATDAACWMPIILLGLLSLAGITVPPQVFAWVAVFVLPLNAAVNPVLYTISTAPFLTPARRGLRAFKRSWKLSLTADQRRTFSSSLGSTHVHNCNLCDVNCPLDVNIFMENGGGVATAPEHSDLAGGDDNNDSQHFALFSLTRRQPQAAHAHRWCSRSPQQRASGDWRSGRWRGRHPQQALASVDTAVSAGGEVIPLRQVAGPAPAADSRRRRLRELYD